MSGGAKYIRSYSLAHRGLVDKTGMAMKRETITKAAFDALNIAEIPKTLSPVPAKGLGKLLKAIF